MGRYFDKIGYAAPSEIVDGVWVDVITERSLYGDVLEAFVSNQEADNKLNTDVSLQQRLSVVADAFALENFSRIKYARWMGTNWSVISTRVERPRLILTLGGVYNGPTASESA